MGFLRYGRWETSRVGVADTVLKVLDTPTIKRDLSRVSRLSQDCVKIVSRLCQDVAP